MKVSGIICEYNPLHNGHVYHIRETRRNGATHIVCVLSGNFVQRGDVALLGKFDRARLAVRAGADLVVELPTPQSCAPAELYASGAIWLLHNLGVVDELSFGSASGDIETISLLTEAIVSTTTIYGERIRERMKQGESYPAAVFETVRQRYGDQVASKMYDPNNILAIEYCKAMQRQHVRFSAFTVPRRYVVHDSSRPAGQFASASFLRKSVLEGELNYPEFVPSFAAKLLSDRIAEGRIASMQQLERVALYRLRTISTEELLTMPDMNQSLASRFYAARNANSLEEFLAAVKTRCYTMSRIRRIVMSTLLGIPRELMQERPPYVRVLAFNDRGRELLGMIQERCTLPVNTSLSRLRDEGGMAEAFVRLEERASHVYGLAQGTVSSAEEDLRARIVMEGRR